MSAPVTSSNRPLLLTPAAKAGMYVLLVLGALTLGIGLFVAPTRTFSSFLTSAYLGVSIAVGAVAFLAMHAVSNAGWHTALKRVPEAMGAYLPVGAVTLLLVLPGVHFLYHWSHHDAVEADALLKAKSAYLNFPFFALRMVGILGLWTLFAWVLRRRSRAQDLDGSVGHTRSTVAYSALFLAVFGLSFSLASFDWLMSLEPHWFSTIFGLYNIAGSLTAATSVIAVLAVILKRQGHLPITGAHLHDLGKLMFGFCTFWAYLWLSQYLLIWYANIPEETQYYLLREDGRYTFLFWLNVAINWAVPFVMLLPKPAKKNETNLLWAAGFLLTGRWLDIYLMAAPSASPEHQGIGLLEIGALAVVCALFVLVVTRALAAAPLVARRDPYLGESLHHHG